MISEEEKKVKIRKLFIIWNFLTYESLISIRVFLVYLYSAYVFMNK